MSWMYLTPRKADVVFSPDYKFFQEEHTFQKVSVVSMFVAENIRLKTKELEKMEQKHT